MDFLEPLQVLWDYLQLHQVPQKADVILVFGCYDTNVARRAAELYRQGLAPWVLFTGGLGRNTEGLFAQKEAECFARVAEAEGVSREAMVLETESTNTKENIRFSRRLLEERNIPHGRLQGVHKPYMERRIHAAMGVYWPEPAFSVTSFPQTLEEALADTQGLTREEIISTIVGDFQRIEVYAQKGFQLPQHIPEAAWEAFRRLVAMGYDRQLVK